MVFRDLREQHDWKLREFDTDTVRSLVQAILVKDDSHITVEFYGGGEIFKVLE